MCYGLVQLVICKETKGQILVAQGYCYPTGSGMCVLKVYIGFGCV